AEWNGTFGAPTGSAPLARNRGTSPYTSYLYAPFNAAGGPQDYYYGITNNTSSKFTTVNTWDKPDAGGYRVFQLWDITGDHTGTNNTQGNIPCDTTKPYNAVTNPCGYMLVVNSSYRADTAFTYTVNNLCPNTYYEISAWFKNICYKCGCDSAGRSATTTGYIPTALGDSSGVRPNIAFDVNGMDYYTTGNLLYKGTTPTGSDATNQWQKRGFVYLTGPSETSFTLTLRNNAPGGGGNDWALDDISVATCLPNMQYSPSLNPTTCNNNIVIINDTIRSYFNNYTYYKWQRSIDNGSTWNDISGANGQETPYWNGSSWQYITSYTVPQANTTVTNNGDKYRVVVATTSSNIGNGNCQVTDGISTINLNVIDCGHTLATKLLSFTGKLVSSNARLSWSTTQEMEKLSFEIEKSTDGLRFIKVGTVNGYYNNAANNVYAFTDTTLLSGKAHYRLAMVTTDGKKSYSPAIQLTNNNEVFALGNVVNPFRETVS
ncbi:MAG TPA: hypothetical protein VFL47_11435, partial [Flavisolibacter sp.]|nr:hypothetical protein [Flavisolibacter sp.]